MNSSVTVRACASQAKVCAISFEKRGVCGQQKSDFPRRDLLAFACSDDGAPPQGHMPIFSEVPPREDPVLETTPDLPY